MHNHAQVVKFRTEWPPDSDDVSLVVIGKDRASDDEGKIVAMATVDGKDHKAVKDAVERMTGIASSESRF